MNRVLLIGIGNTLRRDDGAGHEVVRALEHNSLCQIILTHQLLPELVDELTHFTCAVFVDASATAHEVKLEQVESLPRFGCLGHVGDVSWILDLCRQVHLKTPVGYLLSIPVADMGIGEGFSDFANQNISKAVAILNSWLCKSERSSGLTNSWQ